MILSYDIILENFRRTENREQTENSKLEATLILCGSSGERANFRRTENREQTDRQTDREFNYRGHSYPLWIVGVSGPIY